MTQNTCPYFPTCGGCLYMDMPTSQYLEKKRSFILRSFADYGLTPVLQDIVQIPLHARRRAAFAFHKGHLGFNGHKSHTIVDISGCFQLTDSLNALLDPLRDLVLKLDSSGDIYVLDTPFGIDMHIKTNQNKNARQSKNKRKSTPAGADLNTLELLADFGRRHNIARLLLNNDPILEKVPLPFLPDTFLQPSIAGENELIRLMMEAVHTQKTAVDLFCGSGTFTRPLIKAGLQVTGYDSSADSVKSLGVNGQVRDLFRNPLMADEFNGIDLVVMDPPRAGALAQTQMLAQTNVPSIVLISCNPSTCARDIQILIRNGWDATKVTPVDQFTYSNHIELVCLLSKKS